MNSQASPATTPHVTGSNHYALLTTVAPMGAALRAAAMSVQSARTRAGHPRARHDRGQ